MGKNSHRGKGGSGGSSQQAKSIPGMKQPVQQASSPPPKPSPSPTIQQPVATTSLRSADHERASACLAIKYGGSDRKAWTQSLAALPMAIRVQGLARTVALAKDSDWEACKSLLKALHGLGRISIAIEDLGHILPDKNDGTDEKRKDLVQAILKEQKIAERRRLEHEAIEHAGWLKALNPVEKKAQDPKAASETETTP